MIIEFLNGRRVDLEETYRIKRLFHRIPSLEIQHQTQNIYGAGSVVNFSNFNKRVIRVEFLYDVDSIYGYYLLRDELHALFSQTEPFYIMFKREMYKRYLVRLNSQFEIDPAPNMNSFEVEFLMENNYAESIAVASRLQSNSPSLYGWDGNVWGFGSGIDYDTNYQYTFEDVSFFTVKNIGNATIDPRESQLDLRVRGDFPNGLTIQNNTTGDVYEYRGSLVRNQLLEINGVRTFVGGVSAFSNTNKQLLTLAPGDNNIQLIGGTNTRIEFIFRFLYK